MEYYEVAARWWADKLRYVGKESYNMGEKDKKLDSSAMIQGTMQAIQTECPEENIDSFEKLLAKTIKEMMEKYYEVYLYTDYFPLYTLREIAQEAGIPEERFPWKTHMHITHKKKVRVRLGCNSKYKVIFPTKNK